MSSQTVTLTSTNQASAAERRKSARSPCVVEGLARPLGEGTGLSWQATIRDISSHGVALICRRRFERGTYVMVERETAPPAPRRLRLVRVIYAHELEDGSGWLIGCAFASELSQTELRFWVPEPMSTESAGFEEAMPRDTAAPCPECGRALEHSLFFCRACREPFCSPECVRSHAGQHASSTVAELHKLA
ncbi:MAG TPA: PilZ domain-containing protein [Gemmataceae bacterium]|nr:PilZ domain-containing protein [Gemmataceae bacterium]